MTAKPTTADITNALRSIESTERPEDHARSIARRKVQEWLSDAARQRLPTVNVHDTKGAPVLKPDVVLDHSAHDRRLGRK